MRPATTRDELVAELDRERFLPVLPPPPLVVRTKARTVRSKAQPKRRPTGTGWPAS